MMPEAINPQIAQIFTDCITKVGSAKCPDLVGDSESVSQSQASKVGLKDRRYQRSLNVAISLVCLLDSKSP